MWHYTDGLESPALMPCGTTKDAILPCRPAGSLVEDRERSEQAEPQTEADRDHDEGRSPGRGRELTAAQRGIFHWAVCAASLMGHEAPKCSPKWSQRVARPEAWRMADGTLTATRPGALDVLVRCSLVFPKSAKSRQRASAATSMQPITCAQVTTHPVTTHPVHPEHHGAVGAGDVLVVQTMHQGMHTCAHSRSTHDRMIATPHAVEPR